MRQVRYRALIALDSMPAEPDTLDVLPVPRQYVNHTHALMIRAHCLTRPDYARCFPAELCWDDEQPLHPGDHAEVTITMTDDEATGFFGAGQRFSLWNGADIGHGTISRRVYSEYGPC
ncbi:MAG: hypothetical protein ACRDL9_16335 [Trebonia sp.]